MANVLVVANETLGGQNLIDAVVARAAKGDAAFYVIAPQNQPKAGYVVYDDAVRDAAEHRLKHAVDLLSEAGVKAHAEIMDPDPYTAIKDAVAEFKIDEIFISTHPETRSGWTRRDLIERVQSSLDIPVTHIVVDLDEQQRRDYTHTLVLANQTAAGTPLLGLLKGKSQEKNHRFTVIVPPKAGEGHNIDAARDHLRAVLDKMRSEGIDVVGSVGDPDPFTAVMNALQYYAVDEIVISTFPSTKSGWLGVDLIERVRRSTATPVEHVVVHQLKQHLIAGLFGGRVVCRRFFGGRIIWQLIDWWVIHRRLIYGRLFARGLVAARIVRWWQRWDQLGVEVRVGHQDLKLAMEVSVGIHRGTNALAVVGVPSWHF